MSFERDPLHPKVLKWYIILLIVVGGLSVIGLVVFLVVRCRKKEASKDSLLSANR